MMWLVYWPERNLYLGMDGLDYDGRPTGWVGNMGGAKYYGDKEIDKVLWSLRKYEYDVMQVGCHVPKVLERISLTNNDFHFCIMPI